MSSQPRGGGGGSGGQQGGNSSGGVSTGGGGTSTSAAPTTDMECVDAGVVESLASNTKVLFLEKVRQSNVACQNGDYERAIQLYTDAIALDPANHILYSNRSAAYIKVGKYGRALQDAVKAKELHPKWAKAYYRQGVALQYQERHADALAAFASGLAQEPKSLQLLAGLVESAMKSPLRVTLEPTYRQLQSMHLDKSPFVIISVIGQELLAAAHYAAAVVVLESALHIGTCSLKLRGSVFSALSSSYWALNSLDKAINYMQKDLAITKSLGDIAGECRAHGNLGSAYFSKGNYKEALTSHRYQLVLAMKCKDTQAAASALTSLGHVYTAIGDYPNALASHKQCVQLVKQIGDKLQEAREIGNVGAVYLATGDFDSAVECHLEHLRLADHLGNKVEEARAHSNLGSSHHFKRNFEKAIAFHERVLQLARELGDKSIEARAYAGLGHAARCLGDYQQAKRWHERQLDTALSTRDKVGEGRACSNLGIVYQLLGDHDAAHKLHQAHLNIAKALQDRAGMGRAYGNMGNAHSAMGHYEQAIKYHKQELTISKEVNDRNSEASTHGNLAVAYQALGMCEMALLHYHSHLNIARELKDTAGEACALLNMANCHSSCGDFVQAVPYYESYLMLSQELHDVEGEAKACHFLGYAHYCLGNFKEAIRYYNQDLSLAKDLQDSMSIGRAHCNLGLSHLALGNYSSSLECQKYFLAIAHMMKHVQGKFRALGNIGDVLMKMKNTDEAIRVYQKQLQLAKQSREKSLEAGAYGALGLVFRTLKCYDKALGYHTQELTLRQETNDLKGECKAHGHLGAVHMSLGNYTNAIKCYEEQLERAKELKDLVLEAQAFGNLGIARLNMGHFEDAIGYFEQQLATLEQVTGPSAMLDKGRSFGSLGECYDALGDFDEAIKCHEQYLTIAFNAKSLKDQDRAYRGLGSSHKCLGNLQQALVCFEKRLVMTHELNDPAAKASAYGELGQAHSFLGNYEQAISCLEHQLTITRGLKDRTAEADAVCGLGTVYQQMGEYQMALRYHQMDLTIAEETGNMAAQGRSFGNLGVAHECLGNYEQAIRYQEQHLSIAAQVGDSVAKTLAFSSLGRIHHALSNLSQAVAYLQQGLQIAEVIGRREDEAKIRHRLGLALWGNGDLEGAQLQLYRAADLFEGIRRECHGSTDYRLSLFDLQTASYQALQRVLVGLGRQDEALVVAERGRTRAFVDLLLERQGGNGGGGNGKIRVDEPSPTNVDHLLDIINRQKAVVLYYSLAAGYLYTWLIIPNKGIVSFNECCISDLDVDSPQNGEESSPVGGSLLEQYILNVREALGVEGLTSGTKNGPCETESEASDVWGQHLEELGDKLNQEGDRSGFLRMVNRGHLFNSSSYSLSSLFSLGSWNGSITSGSVGRPGSSTRAKKPVWAGPACLGVLYDMLLGPVEEHLPKSGAQKELVVVLEGDLYLVPFAVLRGSNGTDYLCERFDLLVVPSIGALKKLSKSSRSNKVRGVSEKENSSTPSALIVGNPKLSTAIADQWGWGDVPYAEQEASCVAEILGISALTGPHATKETVLRELSEVECIHFATHVSWKLSAIVLSPREYGGSGGGVGSVSSFAVKRNFAANGSSATNTTTSASSETAGDGDDQSEAASTIDLPSLSEFLLTASDILNLRLTAKLVVISSCHTRNHHGRAHSDGVVGLTRALLAAGAQCVLVSLWPVPDTAVKILFRTFYSSLLQGSRVSRALSEAMQTVQNTKHFAHPANWGGFLLVGTDVKLSSKVALMGQALCELLKTPDTCRDALRVVLHLVEKSLQRIHWRQKNAMYTTQKSIENKVGPAIGWKDLLMSVGFRFEPAANGIPASVFFPQSDPGERLTQCSASLQALLGLSSSSLNSLSKLLSSPEAADDIIMLVRQVVGHMNMKDSETESVEIPINVKLWRVHGCHELLASLGFDLMDVGQDAVTLRAGKQASKRQIQFVVQALLALFDTQEAPRSLGLDECSSMESLDSCDDSPGMDSPPLPTVPMYMGDLGRTVSNTRRGAFSTYVRNRGEPDGRTMACNENQQHQALKGRTNDAFTPSPVERPPYHMLQQKIQSNSSSSNAIGGYEHYYSRASELDEEILEVGAPNAEVLQPSPRLSLTLSHQTKIKALYPDLPDCSFGSQDQSILESSSSASSVINWESGQSTVRRQVVAKAQRTSATGASNIDLTDADSSSNLISTTGRPYINKITSQGSSVSKNDDSMLGFGCVRLSKEHVEAFSEMTQGVYSPPGSVSTIDHLEKLAVRVEVNKDVGDTMRALSVKRSMDVAGLLSSKNVETIRAVGYLNPGVTSSTNGNAAHKGISTTLPHGHRSSRALSTLETKLNSSFGRPQRPSSKFGTGIYSTIRDYDGEEAAAEAQGTVLVPNTIQNHIRAAQLSRIDREVPISDVYHDRNVGLDLAPSLSKLLVASNDESSLNANLPPQMSQATVDAVRSNLDLNFSDEGLSSFINSLSFNANDNSKCIPEAPKTKPPPPPPPPKQQSVSLNWPPSGIRVNPPLNIGGERKSPPPPPLPRPRNRPSPPPKPRNLHLVAREPSSASSSSGPSTHGSDIQRHQPRDEGDGHSMTESHYSGPSFYAETEPKGTDIQSAYSSFTLYKPHREGAKSKVWEATPSTSDLQQTRNATATNSSSLNGSSAPNPMPRKSCKSNSKYATLSPTYEQYGGENVDDELDSVSMISHQSCSSSIKDYIGRVTASHGGGGGSGGGGVSEHTTNSKATNYSIANQHRQNSDNVDSEDHNLRLSKQSTLASSWAKSRPIRNLLQTSS